MEKFSKEYFYENYNVRKLQLGETVESFDCGDTDLNDFIINEAHHYRKALIAVTDGFEHRGTNEVVGYFSLANDRVSVTDFENKTGCRFITVDAYINAVPFYEHNDFQHLKIHDEDRITRLLFFDLSDIDE